MGKNINTIKLSKEQKTEATSRLKKYIEENFDIEIGKLQSEIFLDFISDNLGMYYYNKGVADSLSFMTEKTDDLYLLMKEE